MTFQNGKTGKKSTLLPTNASDKFVLSNFAIGGEVSGGGGADDFVFGRSALGSPYVLKDFQSKDEGNDRLDLSAAFPKEALKKVNGSNIDQYVKVDANGQLFVRLTGEGDWGNVWAILNDVAGEMVQVRLGAFNGYITAEGGDCPCPNVIVGTEGVDSLLGTECSDIVVGGLGNDSLAGGLGRDLFIYKSGVASPITNDGADGIDTITDFVSSSDKFSTTFATTSGNYSFAPGTYTVNTENTISNYGGAAITNDFSSDGVITFEFDFSAFVGSSYAISDPTSVQQVMRALERSFSLAAIPDTGVTTPAANGNFSGLEGNLIGANFMMLVTNTAIGGNSYLYEAWEFGGDSLLYYSEMKLVAVFENTSLTQGDIVGPVVLGTNIDDTLTGTAGGDYLFGLGGADAIDGGLGNDFIFGGAGSQDVLTGAAGTDTFVFDFSSIQDAGTLLTGNPAGDRITDFVTAVDKIAVMDGPGGSATNYTEMDGTGIASDGDALAAARVALDGTVKFALVYNYNNSGLGALYYDTDGLDGGESLVQLVGVNAANQFTHTDIIEYAC